MINAKAFKDCSKNPVSLIPSKVNIDVRWILAGRREKSFKVQMMGNGIHIGDEETVGDDGCSS